MMFDITEKDIVSKWKSDNVVVSVCMLAFNHEDYVAEALEGVLSQNVDFKYEILVHDDASTDGTADIIRKYAERFPRIVKPIFQRENCWSRGINPSVFFNYPRVSGKYVAWCEGDDVWTDSLKLHIQIEVLERHLDLDICFHLASARNYSADSSDLYTIGHYGKKDGIIDFDDIFLRTNGMIPTAGCIVRNAVLKKLEKFMAARPYLTCGDIYMQALGGVRGGGFFINRTMSYYRFRTQSSLTKELSLDFEKFLNHNLSSIRGCISLWRNYFPEKGVLALKKIIYKRLHWIFSRDELFCERGSVNDLIREKNIEYLYSTYLSLFDCIDGLCKELVGKKIVIYGCGNEASILIDKLGAQSVEFVIDRDEKRLDGEFDDVSLKPFNEISKHPDAILIVSTMYYDAEALAHQARICGVDDCRILRMENEILALIDINGVWQGEYLVEQDEVLASISRPSGWWMGDQKGTVVVQ